MYYPYRVAVAAAVAPVVARLAFEIVAAVAFQSVVVVVVQWRQPFDFDKTWSVAAVVPYAAVASFAYWSYRH